MKKWDLNNTTGKETACIVGKSSYRSSRNYIHVEKYPPLYDTSMPISDRSRLLDQQTIPTCRYAHRIIAFASRL